MNPALLAATIFGGLPGWDPAAVAARRRSAAELLEKDPFYISRQRFPELKGVDFRAEALAISEKRSKLSARVRDYVVACVQEREAFEQVAKSAEALEKKLAAGLSWEGEEWQGEDREVGMSGGFGDVSLIEDECEPESLEWYKNLPVDLQDAVKEKALEKASVDKREQLLECASEYFAQLDGL